MEIIINSPMYSTDNYALGVIMETHEKELVGAYGVINKDTEVCEFASSQLPYALGTMLHMEKELAKAREDFMDSAKPAILDEYKH
jgi:hypothetical protein